MQRLSLQEVKSERQNKCDVTYTWNPKKKKDTNEFIYKTEIESQTKNKTYDYQRGREGERDKLGVCG